MTDDDLARVRDELRAREPLFHRTELGTTREWFLAETADDYWEVGASGNVYDREYVWRVLEERYAAGEPDAWEVEEFEVRGLGGGVFLATYLLRQGERLTRRATLWERAGDGWRAVYHQGTLATRDNTATDT